jgi:hypothetical protein
MVENDFKAKFNEKFTPPHNKIMPDG